MNYFSTLLPLLIFFTQTSFGQFKNTYSTNGNPTTQIIDASGMKQGSWNYFDSNDQLFRTETYSDNVLTKNAFLLAGSEINIMGFRNVQLSELSSEAINFITKNLQPFGNGELIIVEDNSVYLYFYLDKLKKKVPANINLGPIKQLMFKNSILKF